ncbi:enolase C-terminal domain-like protein [Dyadobacter bucti]|uniref:enolase C-terminal domain-like protein n=1 Tax=Dyadobacter bucti TaxID=2572203 RepID=UPI003F6F9FE9
MDRRDFIRKSGMAAVLAYPAGLPFIGNLKKQSMLRIISTDSDFEREPLLRPFGFKGGYLTELWQTASRLSTENHEGIGLATQSVLYGDAELFSHYPEAAGNALMYVLTQKASLLAREIPFADPVSLMDELIPRLGPVAANLTDRADLSVNFILNALVSIDNAAWLLYARENGLTSYDDMVPAAYKIALSHQNRKVAVMFQVPYGMPVQEIQQAVDKGYFVIKIKTGQPGSQAEMLEKDKARLAEIHQALKDKNSTETQNGRILYTLDSNGRYQKRETLEKLIDYAHKIGAFSHILFIEEPLPETSDEHVGGLGLRIAADERANDEASTLKCLELGYGAIILKGVAKTLSLSMKIARIAHAHQIPCACSDLTVNPALLEWHKNLAARLAPFPDLGMGLLETNGDMNYKNWEQMRSYLPDSGASWASAERGVFRLDRDFYDRSGGIFDTIPHYKSLFHK